MVNSDGRPAENSREENYGRREMSEKYAGSRKIFSIYRRDRSRYAQDTGNGTSVASRGEYLESKWPIASRWMRRIQEPVQFYCFEYSDADRGRGNSHASQPNFSGLAAWLFAHRHPPATVHVHVRILSRLTRSSRRIPFPSFFRSCAYLETFPYKWKRKSDAGNTLFDRMADSTTRSSRDLCDYSLRLAK